MVTNEGTRVHVSLLAQLQGALRVLHTDLGEAIAALRAKKISALKTGGYVNVGQGSVYDALCGLIADCTAQKVGSVMNYTITSVEHDFMTSKGLSLGPILHVITDSEATADGLGHSHDRSTPHALIHEHEAATVGDQHEQIIDQQFPDLQKRADLTEEV